MFYKTKANLKKYNNSIHLPIQTPFMIRAFLFCILFIFSIKGIGQTPFRLSFHHLTREDGLSNNNIFYFHTDTRGYTWMGGLSGLNRFDGVKVITYKPHNSKFVGIRVLNIKEDKSGNLWIGSDAGLNFYNRKKDEFELIEGPDHQKKYYAYPIKLDDKGHLWLIANGFKNEGLYTYDILTKKYTFITNQIADHLSINQGTDYQPVKTFISAGKDYIGIRKLCFDNNRLTRVETFLDGKNGLPALRNLTDYVLIENDSIAWITGANDVLYKFNYLKNTLKAFKISNKIDLLQMTNYQNYLIIGSGKGLVIFDKDTGQFVQKFAHSKSDTYGLASDWNEVPYVDKKGNLFLAQLGVGIDFTNINRYIAEHWLKPEEVEKLGLKENWVVNIMKNNDFTFAQLRHGENLILNKKGEIVDKFKDAGLLFVDSKSRTWLTDGQSFITYNPLTKKKEKLFFKELAGKFGWQATGTETEKGHYLFTGDFGMYEYDEKLKKLSPILEVNNRKFINIMPIFFEKNTKQVFFSANWWAEQYVLDKRNSEWKIKTKLSPQKDTYGFRPSYQLNKIWLCTNKGLQILDSKTFKTEAKTEKDGLPDNSVTDILEEANGNYWLVTNKGIAYFDKTKNEYREFTTKDGAYSPEYDWNSAFRLSNGKSVFGGKSGISVFDNNALRLSKTIPKVQISQLYVNEKPFKTNYYIGETEQIELKPSQNTFSFDLVGIEYGFPEKVKLQYQLQSYDKQWVTSKNPATARYVNVPEGTYIFMVKATDENDLVSSETKSVKIIVHAPFYRTTWFRILMVVGFIGLGYLLYRLRLSQVREEAKKKEEIRRIRAEAEINALRSQMNPHFIFNCLNTVDSYILLNKSNEASEFLNKFSKLIRMILENSRQEFIPIEQDVKALELYIKLEQERSYPPFAYEINIDEKLYEQTYYIPSMLIQPFIENAILHGLRHKKEEIGEVYLNIKKTDNQIIIHIIDNGIGREAAKKINNLKTLIKKSVGLKLTEERIEKLNELYPEKTYLKITDINEGKDKGTIVEIGLPLITHETLKV